MSRILRHSLLVSAVTLSATLLVSSLVAQDRPVRWVGTWATATVPRPQTPPTPAPTLPPFTVNSCPVAPAPPAAPPGQTFAPAPFVHLTNQTLRQIVHISMGGSSIRVVLSNASGTTPLTVGAAQIALRDNAETIVPTSSRPLTFSGRATISMPAGAIAYSDPVELTTPAFADLALDLYLPGSTNNPSPLTIHQNSFQTNYISETGNYVGKAPFPTVARIQNWIGLARVEVLAPATTLGLVTFGDSITDGTRSTPDTNSRWPDQLMRRLAAQSGTPAVALMNVGIAGNRVLSEGAFNIGVNALARFDADVLSLPGVTHVIVLEGINDIGQARLNPTPTAEDIITGHKQLIARAHARGLAIIGGTLTPFYGAANYTEPGEAKRQAVNDWIRNSKSYDAVIDFDKATRDPGDAKRLLPAYDSCDHLHPNDAGYKAMADGIDLGLFVSRSTR
jgi:lysophospholipase L1-like esterase